MPERWRPGYLFGLAAQPDGPLLGAACSDGRLRLWTRDGGDAALAPLCTLPWNQAMGADCVFGRNGLFCAVSKDGSVIMMVRFGWAAGWKRCLAACWWQSRLFWGRTTESVKFCCWSALQDVRQGACLQHLQLEAPLLSCAMLDGGGSGSSRSGSISSSQCLVAAGADGAVYFVDVTTGG